MKVLKIFTLFLAQISVIYGDEEVQEAVHEEDSSQQQKSIHYPYRESIDVTPLPRNNVLLSFDFQLESEISDLSNQIDYKHYKAFPKSIASILETTNTKELHLRFGQGWWDAEEWGQIPHHGEKSGGIGVEVWAVIEAPTKEESFESWIQLVNSLSGLFCASLNFIDSAKTTFPQQSFKPLGNVNFFNQTNKLFLLRAALPSEPVCTENLTPFVKFLPTRGKSGLSSLLDGHRLFDSQWHQMSIDVETKCSNDKCHYEMDQRVDTVVDVNRALRRLESPIPKPLSGEELICDLSKPHDEFQCFPLGGSPSITFSLSDIFGRKIKGANLLSNTPSKICSHTSSEWNTYLKSGEEHFGISSNCFDLTEKKDYDLVLQTENSSSIVDIKEAPIFVSRSLTGYGQDRGGSRTVLRNPNDQYVRLIYFESSPWFMRIYLHSLEILGGEKDEIVKSIYYSPEIDRKRPNHVEFEIVLPPKSNIILSYTFDKSLLLYAEYPPDANHGFSIEPGVVFVNSPFAYTLRTSSALLTLPTPDFSMPYNVIILSSTVMALAFGTLFNLVVKRVMTEEEANLIILETGPKAMITKLKTKVRSFLKLDPASISQRNEEIRKVEVDEK